MAEHALRLTPEEVRDMSLVDIALELLRQTNKPHYYRDIMNEIARLRGMTEEEVNQVIARLYTEINMDGRFLCIGNNVWGLKRWYPTDKTAEKSTAGSKKFIRKDIDWEDEEEDDEVYAEEDEDEIETEEEDDIYIFGRHSDEDEEDEEDGEDAEDLGLLEEEDGEEEDGEEVLLDEEISDDLDEVADEDGESEEEDL